MMTTTQTTAANDNATRVRTYEPQYVTFTGDKVAAAKDLTTTQIAALIRADIKAAQKSGQLAKDLKVSIRTEYFSMGSSINIRITAAPFAVLSDESLEAARGARFDLPPPRYEEHSTEARAAKDLIHEIAMSYNRTVTDYQTDYFEKRYFASVDFASALEQAERTAYVAHFGKEVR